MANDQNSSHGRRSHYHRARRGGERRATERRGGPPPPEQSNRDHVDVEQIMRDIRARISTRHGIDFTPQQIQELAARRLEAILEPRHARPALLEQMRRAAGEAVEIPAPAAEAESPFDEASLYESHNSFVRALRKLLNPILKLFFNPAPIARALTVQTVRNNAAAQRESELSTKQAEWNALHFEIVQRLVTEIARTTLEMQSLTLRVEALDAKLDFSERRIRAMEAAPSSSPSSSPSRPLPRQSESPSTEPATAVSGSGAVTSPAGENGGDGARRRRRRRRGRRSGPAPSETSMAAGSAAPFQDSDADADGDDLEAGDIGDIGPEPDAGNTASGNRASENTAAENTAREKTALENTAPESTALESTALESTALEPAHHFSLLQPAERYPSGEGDVPEASGENAAARERDVTSVDVTGEAPPAPGTPPSDEDR
jgi:hypothetical protein